MPGPRVDREQVIAFRLGGATSDRATAGGETPAGRRVGGIRNAPPGAARLVARAGRRPGAGRPRPCRRGREDADPGVEFARYPRLCPDRRPGGLHHRGAARRRGLGPPAAGESRRRPDRAGISAMAALRRIAAAAAAEALDGRALTKGDLQDAIDDRVALDIWPWCDRCKLSHISESRSCTGRPTPAPSPSARASGTGPGSSAPTSGSGARSPRPEPDAGAGGAGAARPALLRPVGRPGLRGLGRAPRSCRPRCTPGAWSSRSWRRWRSRARDLPRLEQPDAGAGVRLLPPFDLYLLLRYRATVVPDRALQRRSGGRRQPDGRRRRRRRNRDVADEDPRGTRLTVTVEPFTGVGTGLRAQVEAEACGARQVPWRAHRRRRCRRTAGHALASPRAPGVVSRHGRRLPAAFAHRSPRR